MSNFAKQLARLREAANNRRRGIQQDTAYVDRRDLQELIYHFDRIDAEIRALLPKNRSEAILLIAQERKRQIEQEGWTPEHDQQHTAGELALAAMMYTYPSQYGRDEETVKNVWPWQRELWKPSPDNRIKELTKAGALIAAEIDRLQRKGAGE
ncbi:hypothetical protein [Sporomusa malonica]|uniref:Uncharacterized protein n=1 Tax=Sporomusa malonica TaxID=112901 RepID=A0A1W2ASV7_9FIRM|nr:hypothetical protein [Sporomusa malonica]SMC63787.1 hypothetical protein SAMN04488500_10690 [Sporomusa malonica]